VLHQGVILAHCQVARILADTGTQDVNTSFMRLTETATKFGSHLP
jgi:hypothetical protein